MSLVVKIPGPLRNLVDGLFEVEGSGDSVAAVIENLEQNYSGFNERLLEEDGSLRRFVNIFVNGEDIRFLDGLETSVGEGDEISIVPAVAGG
ncbi:MAG: MoaD family protein [Dehalococcoidia bacterium]|nr:MoaD family protein [Dehalococcoidia bacterium]